MEGFVTVSVRATMGGQVHLAECQGCHALVHPDHLERHRDGCWATWRDSQVPAAGASVTSEAATP